MFKITEKKKNKLTGGSKCSDEFYDQICKKNLMILIALFQKFIEPRYVMFSPCPFWVKVPPVFSLYRIIRK